MSPLAHELKMLDHVSIPVADIERAGRFYDEVLGAIGLHRRRERADAVAYGPLDRPAPVFWILARVADGGASAGLGLHVSFQAPDRASVDRFHEAALRCGGLDAGPPGLRPQYTMPFYGAFVIDLDGYKIEAVCRREE